MIVEFSANVSVRSYRIYPPFFILLLQLFAAGYAFASFPPLIDVVTDTAELSAGPHVSIDGEWVVSRPMGDLDGDGLGDRIIDIPPAPDDLCPGVAILPSTLNAGFAFTRGSLDNLVRITDTIVTDNDGGESCQYRNIRGFTEPRRFGDINGDGLIDLLINISGTFDNVPRVVLGTTTAGTRIDLNTLDGSNGFTVVGNGHIVFPVGDINGDGFDDIGHTSGSSELQSVVAGKASYGSVLDVSSLSSEQRLIGLIELSSLRGLGDIDGDGFNDLVAFPSGRDTFTENQIPYLIYGSANLSLSSLEDSNSRVDRILDECGTRQCTLFPVGDIDGDGLDDVLASQRFEAFNIPPRSILYGRAGGLVVREAINDYPAGERSRLVSEGSGSISDTGEIYRGGFSDTFRVVTGQGLDLDGDGVDDLLLRQRITPTRQGWYALFGTPGRRPVVRSLEEADGLLGVVFDLGTALSPVTSAAPPEVGDLDLDGIDDFLWSTLSEIPYVSGRSREIAGLDVVSLGVRRSPSELTLFWQEVPGAANYRISFDDRFIDEVSSNTLQIVISDETEGAELLARVEALNSDGIVLSTQLRRVPAFVPFLSSFSITVHGIDLLELFIEPTIDEFGRRLSTAALVLRDGQVIARASGNIFTDATVQPGQRYNYQLVRSELLLGTELSNEALASGPRLQRATDPVEAVTPPDPNAGVPADSDDDSPAAVTNLRVVRYSPSDVEVFWDRADEHRLQYEVFRDDVLVRTQSGISFFDSRRTPNSGSSYTVVALRNDGSRSVASTVVLEPVGNGGSNNNESGVEEQPDNGPAAPQNLRVVRYSSKDAELFWDRAEEPLVQYDIFRDGVFLRSGFAISFFDVTLQPGTGALYEVVAFRSDGSRSGISSVVLSAEGGLEAGTTPGPLDVRAEVYSDTAAELFWTRAEPSAGIVRTEITRDGALLGESPGNSFFDDTRIPGETHLYTLVSVDASGARSAEVALEVAAR